MRVGLTYDLRDQYLAEGYSDEDTAEFDRADTIDSLADALTELGYEPVRIGRARDLMERLLAGDRYDLVFNIAEGLSGLSREAQVPAILDAFAIPYTFSDAVVLGIALDKAFTKQVLRDAGVPTADFHVVHDPKDLEAVDLPMPLFLKPIAEGTGKGVTSRSRVQTRPELLRLGAELLTRYRQPVLVETFLPGREFTVGILGTGLKSESLGTIEIVLGEGAEKDVYSYVNKERCEELVEYRLVDDALANEAARLAISAWRALRCRDGGRVDLRADASGHLQVLEINPLAGLHPLHSDLPILATMVQMPYVELIDRIMRSAMDRIQQRPPMRLATRFPSHPTPRLDTQAHA